MIFSFLYWGFAVKRPQNSDSPPTAVFLMKDYTTILLTNYVKVKFILNFGILQ